MKIVPGHCMELFGECGSLTSHILNFGSRWRRIVNL